MKLCEFMRSQSPKARARHYFWIKMLAVYLWAAFMIAVALALDKFGLLSGLFSQVLFIIFFGTTVIIIGTVWNLKVPCPRCGWNINLTNKPWPTYAYWVPSTCPNCRLDLTVEPDDHATL